MKKGNQGLRARQFPLLCILHRTTWKEGRKCISIQHMLNARRRTQLIRNAHIVNDTASFVEARAWKFARHDRRERQTSTTGRDSSRGEVPK